MATRVKIPSGTWKAVIREGGFCTGYTAYPSPGNPWAGVQHGGKNRLADVRLFTQRLDLLWRYFVHIEIAKPLELTHATLADQLLITPSPFSYHSVPFSLSPFLPSSLSPRARTLVAGRGLRYSAERCATLDGR
jgi:hypothetical protein